MRKRSLNFSLPGFRTLLTINSQQKETEDPLLDQGMMKEYSTIVSQFINGERDGFDEWEPLGTKLFE